MKLKAGLDEKALVTFIGKGDMLETPNPSSFAGPVVVQLQRGDGAICFESVFSPPYKKNFGGKFIDVAD